MNYESFVADKLSRVPPTGLTEIPALHPDLFDFQRDVIRWALKRGRAAIFADCGLGKTICELEWSRVVAEHTGKRVLILTPLAVAPQMVREAKRFGIGAVYLREPRDTEERIVVTNYERLEKFDVSEFGGIALDESSILKSFDGTTRTALIRNFAEVPFRLAATATPAPNDHMELGNHAEFLGICSVTEMLAEYMTHDGSETQKWMLKGHAVKLFWEWVASWAVAVRTPSDLNYPNAGYDLPPLNIETHVVDPDDDTTSRAAGLLFAMPARGLHEQRVARRASLDQRVEHVAELVAREPNESFLVWCDLNDEGDALEESIPGSVQVAGSDTPEFKEQAVIDFIEGRTRVLISKSSIFGFGMNLQNCARMAFVGVTHSFEQFFQATRRCWRFGQKRAVNVHIVGSTLDTEVLANLRRKERESAAMIGSMVDAMRDKQLENVRGAVRETNVYKPSTLVMPEWLTSECA
jgi:superfamily II DNA or RNA helicase